MSNEPLATSYHKNKRVILTSPITMKKAGGFLWNSKMMIQMNCRGYATSQFMQPEPAKYSHAPNMEAKTFMQPEQDYYAHHPGRFFYIKDEDSGEIFSAPFEPVRRPLDRYEFSVGSSDISWRIESLGIEVELLLTLACDEAIELWQLRINNRSKRLRNISIYPYFTIGHMSWMNQSATFDPSLNALVAKSISPYQKVDQYLKQQNFNDQTFLLSDTAPYAWTSTQESFEGEGGLHCPTAISAAQLPGASANYEAIVAVMQFRLKLKPENEEQHSYKFLFGPAQNRDEISNIKLRYLSDPKAFDIAAQDYSNYIDKGKGCLRIHTPDREFDNFVNQWLPRQMFYHGDVNRLSTDPQTRNYLQDNMGMCYIKPATTRAAFLTTLSQQSRNGAIPDGILLHPDAELKYINQVPHTDHAVWLPICLAAYLNEHNDLALLDEYIPFADSEGKQTVLEHINLAMDYLLKARDQRGLSFIEQGDWCDPMNMVGYKGKGVSAWLSLATAYALNCWADICDDHAATYGGTLRQKNHRDSAKEINQAVNQHLWQGDWYGRGITDNNVIFGTAQDEEGSIYLNPQSWAMLSGAADTNQINSILRHVDDRLATPYGVMMLAPSYTSMREDIGRITQKYPGTAENGSVYNHAAIFYAFSLYEIGDKDRAFEVIRHMLPDGDTAVRRGQLAVYIPNYYRGAYLQFPQSAGRSSQLFNTGTVSWLYRCLIEGLCGLKGNKGDLVVKPQLPSEWPSIKVSREFQGAMFHVTISQHLERESTELIVDGLLLSDNRIRHIETGKNYTVIVKTPKQSSRHSC
ncbi:MAG: hypothetical protein V7711_06385 [Pseudomonadales bacterium]